VSTAVLEAPEGLATRSRLSCRHCPGHHPSGRPRPSSCRTRPSPAQPKTRVRAIAYPASARVELLRLVPPAQRPENSTRYVQIVVAFTFGFEGKHGIGTDTDAGGIVLMGARLYSPVTGRFLQMDPVFGGSCNAYDYACQDPLNEADLAGESDSESTPPTSEEVLSDQNECEGWVVSRGRCLPSGETIPMYLRRKEEDSR
jgi:RHS repeat-associated protein